MWYNIHLGVNAFRILAWVLVLTPFCNSSVNAGFGLILQFFVTAGFGWLSKSLSPLGLGGTLLVLVYVTARFGWRHRMILWLDWFCRTILIIYVCRRRDLGAWRHTPRWVWHRWAWVAHSLRNHHGVWWYNNDWYMAIVQERGDRLSWVSYKMFWKRELRNNALYIHTWHSTSFPVLWFKVTFR